MALAYLLSLLFSIVYVRIAAATLAAERIMIPLLDILQSVPILSFLPAWSPGRVVPAQHHRLELARWSLSSPAKPGTWPSASTSR